MPSKIHVVFPAGRRRGKPDRQPREPVSVESAPEKPLCILLVEDEPFIRAATADYLTDLGHTVFEAKDAPSALRVLDAEGVDLLLTDVGLPGQTGIELALQPRDRFPDIKVVLATGYRLLDGAPDNRIAGAVVLAKPYTIETLAEALASVAGS
ncbi:MAG TPA: response regulator [Rhodomicrobium sp.]|nr:response regulator [Rhodomicrobium sp.]